MDEPVFLLTELCCPLEEVEEVGGEWQQWWGAGQPSVSYQPL